MTKKPHTAPITDRHATRWRPTGSENVALAVAGEIPIAFEYNCVSHAVMMATPADLEDFAVGFSLNEGIITEPSDIIGLHVKTQTDGVVIEIEIGVQHFAKLEQYQRNIAANSGCGLCGKDSIEMVMRSLPILSGGPRVSGSAIHHALKNLPALQTLNQRCHGMHGAALVRPDGDIIALREDIGRHNAMDKIIGHMARHSIDPKTCFILTTSRCSFELVQKAVSAGITVLAAVSAPSQLALTLAEDANMTILGLVRDDAMQIYTDNAQRFSG